MFDFLGHSVFWRHPANDNPLVKVAQDFLDSLYWQEANRYSWPVYPPEYADDDSTSIWLDECRPHTPRGVARPVQLHRDTSPLQGVISATRGARRVLDVRRRGTGAEGREGRFSHPGGWGASGAGVG